MRKRILLADSDPVSLVLITEMLVEKGYSVNVARDAQTCSEEITETGPDILIIDEDMPQLYLKDLLESLTGNAEAAKTQVILLAQMEEPKAGQVLPNSLSIHTVDKKRWSKELLEKLEDIL